MSSQGKGNPVGEFGCLNTPKNWSRRTRPRRHTEGAINCVESGENKKYITRVYTRQKAGMFFVVIVVVGFTAVLHCFQPCFEVKHLIKAFIVLGMGRLSSDNGKKKAIVR